MPSVLNCVCNEVMDIEFLVAEPVLCYCQYISKFVYIICKFKKYIGNNIMQAVQQEIQHP